MSQGHRKGRKGEKVTRPLVRSVLVLLAGICVLSVGISQRGKDETVAWEYSGSQVIRLEVLNGCGTNGIGRSIGDFLRLEGFDVLSVANARSFDFAETIVVDRTGSIENAESTARALGTNNWIQQIDPDRYKVVDVSVVVGKDYRRLLIDLSD